MDIFAAIADERRRLSEQLSILTNDEQAAQSLCNAWTVHDVVAHLTMPLEVSIPKFAIAMILAAGNFDRANERLTRRQAAHPFEELIRILDQKADTRFTPPGEGPEAPLTDVLLHGLDIRWPLGLPYDIPSDRALTALNAVAKAPSGIVGKGTMSGIRFEATDLDWTHGTGATVRGPAPALLLAITGRGTALSALTGDGTELLRTRIAP
ncbi:maleylpyruvate isomerase family mycothiol-dependent enzyme [Gordonia sp. HY002]|uniref:maleylpyruvate isomerase family mycothiol-dependent enzyme n=1 Tax=Gordonia zhenghanii TaxID=2911516 RepID=UPI001EF0D70A|nr:maleylpyruvate isomerase family mycothiol-dependent enzyme [Gordonia zhenghanii]MCF8569953.1 maleylpyruvate isomerase family mycothiol-dependent enzyme [Gordonia zhenghanii]MCF8605090.1 maleylpyruvate isomerase family mycothiol-dependent enzyme [Gordonia zhenghanii]